jgi:hypothetical protein
MAGGCAVRKEGILLLVLLVLAGFALLSFQLPLEWRDPRWVTVKEYYARADALRSSIRAWLQKPWDRSRFDRMEALFHGIRLFLDRYEGTLRSAVGDRDMDSDLRKLRRARRALQTIRFQTRRVPARLPTVRTGIQLGEHEEVLILARGRWSLGPDKRLLTGPEGCVNPPPGYDRLRLSRRFPFGALVWMLGEDPQFRRLGPHRTPAGGEVVLAVNDANVSDNLGVLEVSVVTWEQHFVLPALAELAGVKKEEDLKVGK